jgi:hypothetical protein
LGSISSNGIGGFWHVARVGNAGCSIIWHATSFKFAEYVCFPEMISIMTRWIGMAVGIYFKGEYSGKAFDNAWDDFWAFVTHNDFVSRKPKK